MKTICFWMLSAAVISSGVLAADTPLPPSGSARLQLSVWNPLQLESEDCDVQGLRLNLVYGKNRNLSGLDIGTCNHLTGDLAGIQIGMVNFVARGTLEAAGKTASETRGLQFAPVLNYAENMTGVQLAGIGNVSLGATTGLQLSSFGNLSMGGVMTGVQVGFANQVGVGIEGSDLRGELHGVQAGFVNDADSVVGLQIGLINIATAMSGVQIGLINVILKSPVPVLPVINAHF